MELAEQGWSQRTIMNSNGKSVFATLIAVAVAVGWSAMTVWSIGLSYRGLRFLANYQKTTTTITGCEWTLHKWEEDSYFVAEIYVDKLPYPITRTEHAELSFWDAIRFRDPKPAREWCVGSNISVYHYDKLKVAIPQDTNEPNLSKWRLFTGALRMETYGAVILTPLIAMIAVGALALGGIKLSINAVSALDFSVKREELEKASTFVIRYLNHRISLLLTVVLAVIVVIGLGFAIVKGMLYVESSNSLVTGLTVLVGFALVSFGPTLVFRAVHLLRTTSSAVVVFVQNAVVMAGLSKLAYSEWAFVTREDLADLPLQSWLDLLAEIGLALIS